MWRAAGANRRPGNRLAGAEKGISRSAPFGHGEPIPSRAPAAHPEMTESRALEDIDSKNTGRVARRTRCFRIFEQPARAPKRAGTSPDSWVRSRMARRQEGSAKLPLR